MQSEDKKSITFSDEAPTADFAAEHTESVRADNLEYEDMVSQGSVSVVGDRGQLTTTQFHNASCSPTKTTSAWSLADSMQSNAHSESHTAK